MRFYKKGSGIEAIKDEISLESWIPKQEHFGKGRSVCANFKASPPTWQCHRKIQWSSAIYESHVNIWHLHPPCTFTRCSCARTFLGIHLPLISPTNPDLRGLGWRCTSHLVSVQKDPVFSCVLSMFYLRLIIFIYYHLIFITISVL